MSDVADDYTVEVWPDNAQAIRLFTTVSTQWRVGPTGPYGLDYNVLFHKLDRMKLTPTEYESLETDIRTMELAALNEMSKQGSKNG